ncbi:MAG: hypothetical protein HOQ11_13395 [Gemmatimonadaceae bacterium]|nr:hypothetical protein [Gemmatimonadaceae bacterium]NUR21124.1 hypothetical protein [Gemmatimonadaceae bacterium]NUS98394.1 hypothetical protein [Gemmatimonadaceae bacterium]
MRLSLATLAPALAIAAASLLPRASGAQTVSEGPPDVRGTWQTGATLVICSDGTSSTAGNNACALHGGVKAYPGARGPVNAALQMQDHAKKWEQKLPPASRGGATPAPDSVAAKRAPAKAAPAKAAPAKRDSTT